MGASVGEAVLGKKIGNKAMLWGAIAGTIPDLDVLQNLFLDELTAAMMHRGFSHSIVFSVLLAPLLGWVLFKGDKNQRASLREWRWFFFLTLVTHPILDCFTTYGTQLLWPLKTRLAFNNIFVADPFYTLPFLILVVAAMFYKRTSSRRRKLNNAALIISCSYMLLTFVFKGMAYHNFKNATENDGLAYREILTRPTPLNSFLWMGQVETKDDFRIGYYSIFDSQKVKFNPPIPKGHELLEPYKNQREVQQIIQMSRGWYFVETVGNGFIFNDMRFGQIGFTEDSPHGWRYRLTQNPDGRLDVKQLEFPTESADFSTAFKNLWERLKGN